MAIPWIDGAVTIAFLVIWSLFWKVAIDFFWKVFGEQYFYVKFWLEGNENDRPDVE